jgi:hypothetical protein
MKEDDKKKLKEKQIEDIRKGKWNDEEVATMKKRTIEKEIEDIQKGEKSEIEDIPHGTKGKGKANEKDIKKIQKSK